MENSDHGTTYIRVGRDDGELRPWHYMYIHSIESRLKGGGFLKGLVVKDESFSELALPPERHPQRVLLSGFGFATARKDAASTKPCYKSIVNPIS
jgi:hypothetical protein